MKPEFEAKVTKMGKRHKMINVPAKSSIIPGDTVRVKKVSNEE